MLADRSPKGSYVFTHASWIESVLGAVEGVVKEDVARLMSIDWSEREISAAKLRAEVQAVLSRAE